MAQCIAKVHATGLQCRKSAIAGATVCLAHGARAPQVRAAAARRVARAELEGEVGRLLEQMGADPVPDLIDGLLIAVEHCARMVAVYRIVAAGRGVLGVNRHGEEVADPGVVEYRNWLDQYARLTKLALDAGIDERRIRISEAQSQGLFGCIERAFKRMAPPPGFVAEFGSVLADELRALDAGEAA